MKRKKDNYTVLTMSETINYFALHEEREREGEGVGDKKSLISDTCHGGSKRIICWIVEGTSFLYVFCPPLKPLWLLFMCKSRQVEGI